MPTVWLHKDMQRSTIFATPTPLITKNNGIDAIPCESCRCGLQAQNRSENLVIRSLRMSLLTLNGAVSLKNFRSAFGRNWFSKCCSCIIASRTSGLQLKTVLINMTAAHSGGNYTKFLLTAFMISYVNTSLLWKSTSATILKQGGHKVEEKIPRVFQAFPEP